MYGGLLPQTIAISTYSETAAGPRGVPTPTWTPQAAIRGRLQQTGSTEVTEGQQTTVTDWVLFLPGGTQVKSKDRVVVDSQKYEVVGAPNRVYGATAEHHVEVRLRAVL